MNQQKMDSMNKQIANFNSIFKELDNLQERNEPVVIDGETVSWAAIEKVFSLMEWSQIEKVAKLADEDKVPYELGLYAKYLVEADAAQANESALMVYHTRDMYYC